MSVETRPRLSIERALHETAFYKENYGKYSVPVLRALNFLDHCQRKAIYIGDDELIVVGWEQRVHRSAGTVQRERRAAAVELLDPAGERRRGQREGRRSEHCAELGLFGGEAVGVLRGQRLWSELWVADEE